MEISIFFNGMLLASKLVMKNLPPLIGNAAASFDQFAGRVLQFLRRRHMLDLWMLTRVNRDNWIVLLADDLRGEVTSGQEFSWSDSICKRMTEGVCPGLITDVAAEPSAREAALVDRLEIGAYIGAALRAPDGRLLGTLCGIHRAPCADLNRSEHELVTFLAETLAGFMMAEIGEVELERQNERFHFEAMTDAITYLPNRSAWEQKLEREHDRALRLGEVSFVAVVDLAGLEQVFDEQGCAAGDELLRKAASALRYAVRDLDFVARLGVSEFGLLGIQCGAVDEEDVTRRIHAALERQKIRASVGIASSGPASNHSELWQRADAEMDRQKHRREYSG